MDPPYQQQHEGEARTRDWFLDAVAAAGYGGRSPFNRGKNRRKTGVRLIQFVSDGQKKLNMKLALLRAKTAARSSKTQQLLPSDSNDRNDGARVFLEQVSHVNDNESYHPEDNTTITSIYTYKKHAASVFTANNRHSESVVGVDESVARETDRKLSWKSKPKAAVDDVPAPPVVASGPGRATNGSNKNYNDFNPTSNEISTVEAAREGQTPAATDAWKSPEIWRRKDQPLTMPAASVTPDDDIKRNNNNDLLESSNNRPCGIASDNSCGNSTSPPVSTTYDSSTCTALYQQLEHMTLMQFAQKKHDMADICKDLMQHQEKMSGLISHDILQTRFALIAEQELVAQRQEHQAQHNVASSRQQEEQNAKLDAILTAILNQNAKHSTTSNPMATTTSSPHLHFDPSDHDGHSDVRQEFNYLVALMKQQNRDIQGWMEEVRKTRMMPAKDDILPNKNTKQRVTHGRDQNVGDSNSHKHDQIATLRAENALLKAKNKSLHETLDHLQWQHDMLLNAARHSKRDKATYGQRAMSNDKKESNSYSEQEKEQLKVLARNKNGHAVNVRSNVNRNRQQQEQQEQQQQNAADDTITFTSTITSTSRSDDDDNYQEHAQEQGRHDRERQQQQPRKPRQPKVMVIVGSSHNSKSHAHHDLEELF
jgi:hypothetical protein